MSLPSEIGPEEILLRSLRKRDVDRQRLAVKQNALGPGSQAGGLLSVIRQRIGDDAAKDAAVEHVHPDDAPPANKFWGFGGATAGSLGRHVQFIVDNPEPFTGHADMALGFSTPPYPGDDPHVPTEVTAEYAASVQKLEALAAEFTVAEDPDPAVAGWRGGPLGSLGQAS